MFRTAYLADLPDGGEPTVDGRVVPGDPAGVVRVVCETSLDVPGDLVTDLTPLARLAVLPDEALRTVFDLPGRIAAQDALALGLAADVVLDVDEGAFRGQLAAARERILLHDLALRRIGIGPVRIEAAPGDAVVVDEREARVRHLLRGEAGVVLACVLAGLDLGIDLGHDLVKAALDAVFPDVALQEAVDPIAGVIQNGLDLGIAGLAGVVVLDVDEVAAGGDLGEALQGILMDHAALAGHLHDIVVVQARAGLGVGIHRLDRTGRGAVVDGARGAILVLHRAGVEIDDDTAVGHAARATARGTGADGGGRDGRSRGRVEVAAYERDGEHRDDDRTQGQQSGQNRLTDVGAVGPGGPRETEHRRIPPCLSACAGNGVGCRNWPRTRD